MQGFNGKEDGNYYNIIGFIEGLYRVWGLGLISGVRFGM